MLDLNLILWVGGGLAVLLFFIGLVTTLTSEKSLVDERIGQITESGRPIIPEKERSRPLTDWLNQQVAGSSYGNRIARDLARADLKMKPGEYIALMIIAAFGVALVAWFIGGRTLWAGVAGGLLGFWIPGWYVRRQQGQRLIKFSDQLPDMLNLVVNGLRAGYSTMQAMESVSKELPAPICDEFRRVVQEMQLGISMGHALENLLRRIPSDDLDLVITAVNVQREVGGNLAEILDTISHTIRERIRVKGEIRVLTTQVMYSGKFLAILPLIVIAVLYVMNRDYMMEFFKPESGICGYIGLGLGAILIFFGYITMTKIAQIEV